jgi:hypothetical protein
MQQTAELFAAPPEQNEFPATVRRQFPQRAEFLPTDAARVVRRCPPSRAWRPLHLLRLRRGALSADPGSPGPPPIGAKRA